MSPSLGRSEDPSEGSMETPIIATIVLVPTAAIFLFFWRSGGVGRHGSVGSGKGEAALKNAPAGIQGQRMNSRTRGGRCLRYPSGQHSSMRRLPIVQRSNSTVPIR
jgi:hypothetical protein